MDVITTIMDRVQELRSNGNEIESIKVTGTVADEIVRRQLTPAQKERGEARLKLTELAGYPVYIDDDIKPALATVQFTNDRVLGLHTRAIMEE